MTSTTNPLLARLRLPGETFQLPSQGLFYNNGELDPSVNNGELEIYPMTALDEIIFSSPDKLLSGKAITEVFGRCIPQILKPMDLLTKDIDYLMVCLRLVTFGPKMEVTYEHDCEDAKNHTYTIDLQHIIKSTKKMDPTSIQKDYTITLPNGQIVKLKPMIFRNVLKLYDNMLTKKNEELTESETEQLILNTIISIIDTVDEISDEELIYEWAKMLSLGWKKQIEQAVSNISEWGVNFNTANVCKDCGKEINLIIQANPVNFFFRQ